MNYNGYTSNNNGDNESSVSAKNDDWKITRLTADQDNYEPDPRYNFDDLQNDDVQSINNPDDSETWYECTCGMCYECINNYDEVERDDDDEREDDEYYGEEEYELAEGEDVCSCGNICLFEDALCVDCIEQNKYYTLVPRSGWTDVEYTDEGKDLIKNFPRYKDRLPERSSADILYLLSQEYCEFYYLYKNKSQAAAHQIQVVLGRAFTGN
jgi:hypothetical protein